MKRYAKFKGDEGLVGIFDKENLTIGKYYEIHKEEEINDIGKIIIIEDDNGNVKVCPKVLFE